MTDRVATARRMGTGGIATTVTVMGIEVVTSETGIVTAADGTVRAKYGAFRAATNLAPPSFFEFLHLMLPALPAR